jgi:cobalt-zinc-cadmium efflux system outer membrane protein
MSGLSACAPVDGRRGFEQNERELQARTGQRTRWRGDGEGDAKVEAAVRKLLDAPLTADGAVQVALLRNAHLQATFEELSIAQADFVEAGLLENPVFDVGFLTPLTGAARDGSRVGPHFSVAQSFLELFTVAARRKIARSQRRAIRLRVADEVLGLTREVQEAYYELVADTQVLAMQRVILETSEAAVDLARRQHEAGNINDLHLSNETALYEQVRLDVTRSEAHVLAAREELAALLGLWGPDVGFAVEAKLPDLPPTELDLDEVERIALRNRYDLAAARQDVVTLTRVRALARNWRWIGGMVVGAEVEQTEEGPWIGGPHLELQIPIFDTQRATLARIDAELAQAERREEALAIDVRAQVRISRIEVELAREVVERYAEVLVPLRERVVVYSQQQYDAMLIGVYELLVAKQNEITAYRELIEGVRDYWVARAELDRAAGTRVDLALAAGEGETTARTDEALTNDTATKGERRRSSRSKRGAASPAKTSSAPTSTTP